jgi:hypothetical protein
VESDASVPHPSTNQSIGTDGAGSNHVAEQVQQEEVIKCDKKLCQYRVSLVSMPDVTCHIPIDDCETSDIPSGVSDQCFHVFQRV